MYFKTLVLSAFVIAIFTSAMISVYQAYFITPIILGSQFFEIVEPVGFQPEEAEAWSPGDVIARKSWGFATNFLLCFAYALILLSAMSIKNSANTLKGVFWGAAAYLSIYVAPALGLPPEIPGMEAAKLEGRQAWWLLTVLITAISLWLIVFKNIIYKVLGIILLLLPHFLVAPQPVIHDFVYSGSNSIVKLTRLWHDFILQTTIANALLWLILGASSGFVTKKYIYPIAKSGNGNV